MARVEHRMNTWLVVTALALCGGCTVNSSAITSDLSDAEIDRRMARVLPVGIHIDKAIDRLNDRLDDDVIPGLWYREDPMELQVPLARSGIAVFDIYATAFQATQSVRVTFGGNGVLRSWQRFDSIDRVEAWRPVNPKGEIGAALGSTNAEAPRHRAEPIAPAHVVGVSSNSQEQHAPND